MKNELQRPCYTCSVADVLCYRLVRISGAVELACSQDIRRVILGVLRSTNAIAVDLSSVSYIDTSGVAVLVEAFHRCRIKGRRFALVAISREVRVVLELNWLDRVFPIFPCIEDAAKEQGLSPSSIPPEESSLRMSRVAAGMQYWSCRSGIGSCRPCSWSRRHVFGGMHP